MDRVREHFLRVGPFQRRADLLRAGFDDRDIRRALGARALFRVRHGWYARPDTSDLAVRAIRVGGKVTGLTALKARGLYLPSRDIVDIAVPRTASGLRQPHDRRKRLGRASRVRIHWIDPPRREMNPADWLTDDEQSIAVILANEPRNLAVAACDGLLRYRGWSAAQLATVFESAPRRTWSWQSLVDGRADSWGETEVRLGCWDAGLSFIPQARVPGAGRFDGQVGPRTYVEVDGKQHDEGWASDDDEDWFGRDREKDAVLASLGGRVVRVTYTMYQEQWELVLAALRRAIEVDRRELRAWLEGRRA